MVDKQHRFRKKDSLTQAEQVELHRLFAALYAIVKNADPGLAMQAVSFVLFAKLSETDDTLSSPGDTMRHAAQIFNDMATWNWD